MKRKSVKFIVIAVGLLLIAGLYLVASGTVPVFANAMECQAPDGYYLVENRLAYDLAGNPVFVVRGIVATGEGNPGGKKVSISPCGSSDPSISEISNVFLKLDGQQVILVAGAVGRDLSANPTQAPQP